MIDLAIVNPKIGMMAFPVSAGRQKKPAFVDAGVDILVEAKVAPPTLAVAIF
jgi:hypothetical protein